jgi:cysteine desulfurase
VEAMRRILAEVPGNPSSIHATGRAARTALDEAREAVAAGLGCRPREVVFTGSGSEADTLAVVGSFLALRGKGRHLVVSAVEHPAVRNAASFCAEVLGAEVSLVTPDADGVVGVEAIAAALRPDTVLVSLMAANNETGARMPVAEVGALCRARGVRFHTDAVQAVGRVPVSFAEWPVDLLSLSAHKLHGPKGSAALLVRRGVKVLPVVQGGGQERGLRPGTENLAGIVGLATALRLALAALDAGAMDRVGALRDRLEAGILTALPEAVVNGPRAAGARVPNTLNVSLPGAEAEGVLIGLDRAGVAASSGSACASGSVTPSPVLTAMGLAPGRIASSVRLSLSRLTTEAEVDHAVAVLPGIVRRLRDAA